MWVSLENATACDGAEGANLQPSQPTKEFELQGISAVLGSGHRSMVVEPGVYLSNHAMLHKPGPIEHNFPVKNRKGIRLFA